MAKEEAPAASGQTQEKGAAGNSANSENSDPAATQELEHSRCDAVAPEQPVLHEHLNPRLFMCLVAMSFLWVGSQIPLYLYGSVLPDIYGEIGGSTNGRWVWMVIGYLIPNAALCPFVGALSDLIGRKWVAAFGQVALVVGPVVVSTSHSINIAICGMVIAGLGAGLNELIALAGTSELVPVRKRAVYVGGIVFTILPFCPSPLWAQLITKASGWRYNGYLIGGWNFVGLILVVLFYQEPPKPRRSAREVLAEVDYIGGLLSTCGVVLLMMGLQWGSREHTWTSPQVLTTFLLGSVIIMTFFVYEIKFAKHPMVPARIFSRDKQTMQAILLVTFFSGGNFFVLLLFWPTQVYNVYGNDPLQIGIRTLPIGFGIIAGSVINLGLIYVLKGRIRWLMVFWCVFMTGFVGAMSVARTDNLVPTVYPIITLASIGVGAVIIPCSLIAQVVCPTDLIGTITAITLSIRYIGGAVGFAVFYNVFFHKYYTLTNEIAAPMVAEAGVTLDFFELIALVSLGSNAVFEPLHELIATSPTIHHRDTAYQTIMDAVYYTFSIAYQWPYWISIAFGVTCIICSLFLRDMKQFMAEAF
ncbi:hypothetical protein NLU13_7347 [Sarocladium strictum]|uniref:Major facilitator superfamily (MFS) profile domain-containing protein n=1 Tax=Sarocladium strictum TaxID=5046 RepID=A0AA39GDC0_SARSR|nr:hypothetical protein NLU13_7347 [Sarocladium strictum]